MKETLVTNMNKLGVLCVFHKQARHVYIEQQSKLHALTPQDLVLWSLGVDTLDFGYNMRIDC